MKEKSLKFVLGASILIFFTSIFLLSCMGCGGVKEGNYTLNEKPSNNTIIEKEILNKEIINDTRRPELIVDDYHIILKNKEGKVIFKDSLKTVNPFFKLLDLNVKSYDEKLGLYIIDEKLIKDKSNSIFSDEKLLEIPIDFSCKYVNVSPPALTNNGKDKFVASFLLEWGNGLLNENSIGEFQSSKIFIWNDEGILLKNLDFDFGTAPYVTKNGEFIWLKYGEFIKNPTTKEFDITPCISLFDIKKNRIVFEQKFPNLDLIVGGYNNSTKYFGFTASKGKNNYTIYYFDDDESSLYKKNFKAGINFKNISVEKDFDKIKLQ